jgi:ferric-dicitrate binding protein FerR (iron transport regulator)
VRLSRSIARNIILGLIICLAFRGSSFAQAAGAAGSVSEIQGQVTITRAGRTLPAAYATPVQVGDQITTAPNSRVTLTLSDGTQLELAESSTLVVDRNVLNPDGSRASTEVNLLGGLLHSLVRFAPGNAPNYEVHTPNAVAAARGTDYDTDYVKGTERKGYKDCREFTDVAVYDGDVEVSNPGNPTAGSVKLKKGQKTTVPCALLPLPPSPAAIAAMGVLGAAGAAAVGVTVAGTTGGFGEPVPLTSSR